MPFYFTSRQTTMYVEAPQLREDDDDVAPQSTAGRGKQQTTSSSSRVSLLPQEKWRYSLWMILHKVRWCLSCPLRLPLLPARVAASGPLTNMTWGQGILYAFLWLQVFLKSVVVTESMEEGRQVGYSGHFATIALYLSFLLAYKQGTAFFTSCLCGMSFDKMIPFHKVASIISILLGTFHGWLAYTKWGLPVETTRLPANWTSTEFWEIVVPYDNTTNITVIGPRLSTAYALPQTGRTTFSNVAMWSVDGWVNWSGTFLTLCMALLTFSSLVVGWRRKSYYLWLVVHVLCSALVLVFGWYHFKLSLPLIVTWIADVVFRYAYKACCRYPRRGTAVPIGRTGVVRLSWPKTESFFYHPGQFVRIGLPHADRLVFHPMSIASCPEVDEHEVVVYVRATGPWTNRLLEHSTAPLVKTTTASGDAIDDSMDDENDNKREIRMYVEGPYGSMGIDLYANRKHVLLCVSGGVGAAPCIGMSRWLLANEKIAKLRFVWCVREWDLVEDALPDVLWDNTDEVDGFSYDYGGIKIIPEEDDDTERCFEDEEDSDEERGGRGGLGKEESHQEEEDKSFKDTSTTTATTDTTTRDHLLVETDLYLTSAKPPSGGGGPSALRKTNNTTVFCGRRPEWDEVFEKTRSDALSLGIGRVSVVCCGPMMEDVRRACRRCSASKCGGSRVAFDLHEESFEF